MNTDIFMINWNISIWIIMIINTDEAPEGGDDEAEGEGGDGESFL